MVSQVNIREAKTQLSQLVDRAANGEEIVIARRGTPVSKLVPFDQRPNSAATRNRRRGSSWPTR
jgi:prevent-host-death family protein